MNHLRAALAFVVPLAIAVTASAVLIDGADGARDVSPFPVAELDNIGVRGGCSAIYLGSGVVLTASHVGAGDVTFGGISYSCVPGSACHHSNDDRNYQDLLMFQIY